MVCAFFSFLSLVLVMCLGRHKIEEDKMFCHTNLEVCDRLLKEGYYMSVTRKYIFKSYFYVSFCVCVNDDL